MTLFCPQRFNQGSVYEGIVGFRVVVTGVLFQMTFLRGQGDPESLQTDPKRADSDNC